MSKVKLAVGQKWKTREGGEVKITRKMTTLKRCRYPFKGSNNKLYTEDGVWAISSTSGLDLVELIEDCRIARAYGTKKEREKKLVENSKAYNPTQNGKDISDFRSQQDLWAWLVDGNVVHHKRYKTRHRFIVGGLYTTYNKEWLLSDSGMGNYKDFRKVKTKKVLKLIRQLMDEFHNYYFNKDGKLFIGECVVLAQDLHKLDGKTYDTGWPENFYTEIDEE